MNLPALSSAVLCALFSFEIASADNWPTWRGPDDNGMAVGDAPLHWSDTTNIRWRAEIPGRGHSSPIVWGDRVFLTTAIPTSVVPEEELRGPGGRPRPDGPPPRREGRPEGREGPPSRGEGPPRGGGPPRRAQAEHEFVLLCLDRNTGDVLWQRTVLKAVPHQGYRPGEGSFASESPVTDGRHVIAYFGSRGIYCYDLDGNLVWKRELGVKMEIHHEYGEGTSPVLDGETLFIKADHEGQSFLMALNKSTGEEIWRVTRDEYTSFSVPLVVDHEGRKQVITAASNRVRSYDYDTGELIWECGGLGQNSIPAPVAANGIVYVMTGYEQPKLMAIRLGGKGDITDSDFVLWSTDRYTAYVPSPLLTDGKLYVVRDAGFISAYVAATGEAIYKSARMPVGHTFKSSPVGVNGKIYLASEQNDVLVLSMGDEPKVLALNTLGDQAFVASPAIVDGEIFLRGSSALFCISEK